MTAQTFIQETIDNCSDRPIRGPYLAQLELIKQLQSSTDKPQRNYGRLNLNIFTRTYLLLLYINHGFVAFQIECSSLY